MRFVVLAFGLILLTGFFHVMFIMFDNAWYNDTNGVIPIMADTLNNTLNTTNQNNLWNKTIMFRDAFGMGRVICIILVPICLVLEALDKPRIMG